MLPELDFVRQSAMLGLVPERSTQSSEPPSTTSRTADIGLGTIAMALAAFSMALLVYFMN